MDGRPWKRLESRGPGKRECGLSVLGVILPQANYLSLLIPDSSLLGGVTPFRELHMALIPVVQANMLSLDSVGAGSQIVFL